VAESGGTLVRSDYAASYSARFFPQREGTGAEDRDFAQHYNCKPRPFIWTAKADSILQKIARLRSPISGRDTGPHLAIR
jgi:hypothetical protein